MDKEYKNRKETRGDIQEVLGNIPSWLLNWGITIVSVFILFILIGANIIKYPDVISVPMTLTGRIPSLEVVAKTNGKLEYIYVSDKQHVQSGDLLAIIENDANTNDVIYLKALLNRYENIDSLYLNLTNRKLILGNMQPLYTSFLNVLGDYKHFINLNYYPQKAQSVGIQTESYRESLSILIKQKEIAEQQLILSQQQLKRDSILIIKGILSTQDFEKTQDNYLNSLSKLKTVDVSIQNIKAQINQSTENLLEVENLYQEKEQTYKIDFISKMSELMNGIRIWENNFTLVAPTEGTISFFKYWHKGQNIKSLDIAFTILPIEKSKLIGKALLPMTGAGKVDIGQMVNIHFLSYPDEEFGVVRGVVENISLLPTESYYSIEIHFPNDLKTSYNKELPINQEMQAQADIITDDLTLFERFFMPLKKIINESTNL